MAAWSPCLSQYSVKPVMSTKAKVRVTAMGSPVCSLGTGSFHSRAGGGGGNSVLVHAVLLISTVHGIHERL